MSNRIKNDVPNLRVRNEFPNSRTSAFQVGIKTASMSLNPIRKGMAIGLLLALTYDRTRTFPDVPAVYFGEFRPNIRILNN